MDRNERGNATTEALLKILEGDGEAARELLGGRDVKIADDSIATAEDYAQLFSGALGKKVMADMAERFMCRTYFVPGTSRPEDSVFGDGVRAAFLDMAQLIARGRRDENG